MVPFLLTSTALAASPALRQLVCVDHGGSATDLTDHPVAVVLDTGTWIDDGELDGDCGDLRVIDGTGASLDHWIEEETCDTTDTLLWVRLPSLPIGQVATVVVLRGDAGAGDPADGDATFPFFDDFSGSALNGSKWTRAGNGQVDVTGDLLQTRGTAAVWSTTAAMSIDDSELVVRIDALGDWGDDVELGAGFIDANPGTSRIWNGDRDWVGFTHVSYSDSIFAASEGPLPERSCTEDHYNGALIPSGGGPRAWRRVQIGFSSSGTSTTSWLETDAGLRVDRTADPGCQTPDALPALLVLDHENGSGDPEQRVDFVFVRPTADPAPVPTLIAEADPDGDGLMASEEGCGDADGDGIPDWDDPPDLPTADTGTAPGPTGETATDTGTGTGTGTGTATGTGTGSYGSDPTGTGPSDLTAQEGAARGGGCGCASETPAVSGWIDILARRR